jgi:hypothetical protein
MEMIFAVSTLIPLSLPGITNFLDTFLCMTEIVIVIVILCVCVCVSQFYVIDQRSSDDELISEQIERKKRLLLQSNVLVIWINEIEDYRPKLFVCSSISNLFILSISRCLCEVLLAIDIIGFLLLFHIQELSGNFTRQENLRESPGITEQTGTSSQSSTTTGASTNASTTPTIYTQNAPSTSASGVGTSPTGQTSNQTGTGTFLGVPDRGPPTSLSLPEFSSGGDSMYILMLFSHFVFSNVDGIIVSI